MRVALFTCLFVVCFGNKAHQCGGKLGSCGAPQASLMQVGSSNKRRMSLVSQSASRSGSRVSRALAGFEKYTNNLVSKYVTDRETIPLSTDVIAAIGTVRTYIRGLFDSLNESHYHDIDRIQSTCGQDAEDDCISQYFDIDKVSNIQRLKNLTETARQAHVQCRFDERNDTCQQATSCVEYDQYRNNNYDALPENTPAKCAFPEDPDPGTELGKLGNNFISTSIEIKRKGMETCLKKFRDWFTPLYDLYKACDRGDEVGERESCVGHQGLFEEKICDYNLQLNTTCHSYDLCIEEAKEDCMDSSTGLCKEVETLVTARKAENETGERILCLLTVLVDTENASKKAELDRCTSLSYDTSYFDLDCPGNVGYPEPNPPISCTKEPVPCQRSFLEKYYASSEVNSDTGAHLIPYEAVCDCSYQCTALVGEDAKRPVQYDDFGICPEWDNWDFAQHPKVPPCPE